MKQNTIPALLAVIAVLLGANIVGNKPIRTAQAQTTSPKLTRIDAIVTKHLILENDNGRLVLGITSQVQAVDSLPLQGLPRRRFGASQMPLQVGGRICPVAIPASYLGKVQGDPAPVGGRAVEGMVLNSCLYCSKRRDAGCLMLDISFEIQYPETSIQYHGRTTCKHSMLPEFDLSPCLEESAWILGYIAT